MGKSTISMAIFNSYFDITRGYPIMTSPISQSACVSTRTPIGPQRNRPGGWWCQVVAAGPAGRVPFTICVPSHISLTEVLGPTYIYIPTCMHTYRHYITLHYITLHSIPFHTIPYHTYFRLQILYNYIIIYIVYLFIITNVHWAFLFFSPSSNSGISHIWW